MVLELCESAPRFLLSRRDSAFFSRRRSCSRVDIVLKFLGGSSDEKLLVEDVSSGLGFGDFESALRITFVVKGRYPRMIGSCVSENSVYV